MQIAAFVGKFAISISFALVYVYTAELFPTSVSSLAVGLSSASARVGVIAAPAAVLLGTVIYEDLTMLIFALAALLAGAYAATLPETRGRPSVQTVSELRC